MWKRVAVLAIAGVLGLAAFMVYGRALWYPLFVRGSGGPRSVADVVEKYGGKARERLLPHFRKAGVTYPPEQIALLVFKQERRVALWARSENEWRFIRSYPIRAASGHAGPKLREGDEQVPEGVYRIAHLNPNSAYHLSMKVDYPNDFDRRMAQRDGRTRLGGDIFFHGKAISIGCVAVGDRAIEELFILVAATGHANVKVVIAPNDLRAGGPLRHREAPRWTDELYRDVATALAEFPIQKESDAAGHVQGMPKAKAVFQ